ncbi:hypothetical protein FRB93_008596 [Tulasnella sp. JGI-2019a]|nr:hypothetical protein FRB93_008596 [Tulasnella sp. JGI-2019a]
MVLQLEASKFTATQQPLSQYSKVATILQRRGAQEDSNGAKHYIEFPLGARASLRHSAFVQTSATSFKSESRLLRCIQFHSPYLGLYHVSSTSSLRLTRYHPCANKIECSAPSWHSSSIGAFYKPLVS